MGATITCNKTCGHAFMHGSICAHGLDPDVVCGFGRRPDGGRIFRIFELRDAGPGSAAGGSGHAGDANDQCRGAEPRVPGRVRGHGPRLRGSKCDRASHWVRPGERLANRGLGRVSRRRGAGHGRWQRAIERRAGPALAAQRGGGAGLAKLSGAVVRMESRARSARWARSSPSSWPCSASARGSWLC